MNREDELLLKISSLPRRDIYAELELKKSYTNIGELLRNHQSDAMLCFCESDEKYRKGKSSDFEYFKECLNILPEMRGTYAYDLISTLLSLLCGEAEVPERGFSKETVFRLWTAGSTDIHNRISQLYSDEKLNILSESEHEIACDGKCKIYPEIFTAVINAISLDFVRPDPYHASLARNKEKSGEKLNNNEISLLISQNIYEIISQNKCRKIQINLRCDDSMDYAVSLVEYMKKQKLYAEIFISYESENALEKLLSVCLLSDENMRIVPELTVTDRDSAINLCRRLRSLFAAYPATKTAFGGAVDAGALTFCAHELFNRALSEVLFEIYKDTDTAYTTASDIFAHYALKQ